MKPNRGLAVIWENGRRNDMLIFMLAAAMMLAMLIATAFGLLQEAGQAELRERVRNRNPYNLN